MTLYEWVISAAWIVVMIAMLFWEWSKGTVGRAHDEAVLMDAEWDRQRMIERQLGLLALADLISEAPIAERQRLLREAEALDFDGAA
jgi:hypothetical protein